MFEQVLAPTALFALIMVGLGWPLAARLLLTPAEKLVASVALSALGAFVIAWAAYVCALPGGTLWVLPLLAVGGLAWRRDAAAALWRDPAARALLVGQLLVTLWCIGWAITIVSYSGGGWASDWFEHWERARFFVERWPLDRKFLQAYSLAARPPLVNVVTGAFLQLTRADYAHYQLVTTLLSSLAFLPAGLLAQRFRFGGGIGGQGNSTGAIALLAVLFMLSPLFVQNATFAWTKLPTAFFVLAALYFFLRAHESARDVASALLFATCLAAAILAHYSAGPYAVALAGAWLALGWPHRCEAGWWRRTGLATLAGTLVLALWFGWAVARLGAHETFLSNTSAASTDVREGNQLVKIALNLRDTLVPHFFREPEPPLLEQRSAWGWWRDWFFLCYQVNLPFAFGSIACLMLARELWRGARATTRNARWFWGWFATTVTLLGVATHGGRDHWGLAHICLQALVLLGLAFLAGRWEAIGRGGRLALVAGTTIDFVLGIVLHFAVQSYALDLWLRAGRPFEETVRSYSATTLMNFAGKLRNKLLFLSDVVAVPGLWLGAVLAVVLALALLRTRARAG